VGKLDSDKILLLENVVSRYWTSL